MFIAHVYFLDQSSWLSGVVQFRIFWMLVANVNKNCKKSAGRWKIDGQTEEKIVTKLSRRSPNCEGSLIRIN